MALPIWAKDHFIFDHPFNTGGYNASVMQDRDGFIWVGCTNGIVRYDGYDIKTYGAGPGMLSSSYAPGIFEYDQGHVKITVYLKGNKAEGELVVIVEDTGIGIAEDELEHVFDLFYQQKGQNHNKYGGTGLGLAISQCLAQMLNGTILVSSVPGQGSVFTIRITGVKAAPDDIGRKKVAKGLPVSENKMYGVMTKQTLEQLDRLYEGLIRLREDVWMDLMDAMVIDEIKRFAGTLKEMSAFFQYQLLEQYADQLADQAEKFDMVRLKDTLNRFPEIEQAVSNIIKSQAK